MAEIAVRTAVPEDARAIADVHVRAWRVGYRGLVPDAILEGLSREAHEQRWRELLGGSEAAFTLVAEREGRIAGFCAAMAPSRDTDADPRTCEIGAVYVDPDAWGAGAGRALLAEALRRLHAGGWEAATLWVLEGNGAARAFYARFGFAPDGATAAHRTGARQLRLHTRLRRL
jgi:GNAT superfamily N-acetyltransferase